MSDEAFTHPTDFCPRCGCEPTANCANLVCPYRTLKNGDTFSFTEMIADGSYEISDVKVTRSQTTIRLDVSGDELKMLRDVVIRAHQMTGGNYIQSDSIMIKRAHQLLDAAIEASPVMKGFLGRGGPCANRDILTGSGDLS